MATAVSSLLLEGDPFYPAAPSNPSIQGSVTLEQASTGPFTTATSSKTTAALANIVLEPPLTLNPSALLPKPLQCTFVKPHDLQLTVNDAFEKVWNEKFQSFMQEMRTRLSGVVHDAVEQQLSFALSQYSDQVASCERHVVAARDTIHSESVKVNGAFRRVQELIKHNTKESARLEEALQQVSQEHTKLKEERKLVAERSAKLKHEHSRLQTEEAKLQAQLGDLRGDRHQILQWQQLLAQKEQGIAARDAKQEVYASAAGSAASALQAAARSVDQAEARANSTFQSANRHRHGRDIAPALPPHPSHVGLHKHGRPLPPQPAWDSSTTANSRVVSGQVTFATS